MKISVVVPVLNGEKYIGQCIDSLLKMDINSDSVDIFVVDNGSTDATVSILRQKKVVFEVCPGVSISSLRNTGARNTKGELVGFVDSDCFVDSKWLHEAKQIFKINDEIAVVGSYYGIATNSTWVERTWFDMKKDIVGNVDFLPGGNMLFRREIFEIIGGFNESMVTGEDYEICKKIRDYGYKVYNSPKVKVMHMGNFKKMSDIIRKERWYGKGMFESGSIFSKPLLASLLYIFLLFMISINSLLNASLSAYFAVLMILYLLIVSISFSKKVKHNRLVFIIKFMPIANCYLLGRSLSVIDFLYHKIRT